VAAFPIINTAFIGKDKSHPFIRRRAWSTDVTSYDSSLEQTNELWSYPDRYWGIQYRNLSVGQRGKIIELFDACRGMGRQLYFEDPLDYQTVCSWVQSNYTIIEVDQTEKYFKISGQHAGKFLEDWKFKISGGSNAGIYTVSRSSQSASYTWIYVDEAIPSATPGGTILRMYFQLYKTYYSGTSYSWNEPKKDIKPDVCTVTVGGVTKTEGVDYTLDDTEGIIKFASGYVPSAGVTIGATYDFYYRVRFVSDTLEDSQPNYRFYDIDILWVKTIKRFSSEV